MYKEQFIMFVKGLLRELEANNPVPEPIKEPDPVPRIARVRFRLMRAQFNKQLHPEMYTPDNPDGLYSGKDVAAIQAGHSALNRESNGWLDLTAYDDNGVELDREMIKRVGLAYQTLFTIGDGFIRGHGADSEGRPNDWDKENPQGCNISEETWRTSLGFTVRVHFADEGVYTCDGAIAGQSGEAFTVRVS